jgi:hypothetical protein
MNLDGARVCPSSIVFLHLFPQIYALGFWDKYARNAISYASLILESVGLSSIPRLLIRTSFSRSSNNLALG